MTGLLQRLAARAAGSAWTVRSDVRLPFAAAGANGDVLQDAPPMVQSADPEARPPMQAGPETAVSASAASQPAGTPAAQQRAATAQPERTPPTPLMKTTLPVAAPHTPVAAPLAQPPELAPRGADPAIADKASPRAPAAPPPVAAFAREDPASLLPSRPQAAQHPALRTQPLHGAAAIAAQAAAQAVTSQETEVHIHIGRIDVTALHEAPRPKARPRERAQPVSLDAYLAARSKA